MEDALDIRQEADEDLDGQNGLIRGPVQALSYSCVAGRRLSAVASEEGVGAA